MRVGLALVCLFFAMGVDLSSAVCQDAQQEALAWQRQQISAGNEAYARGDYEAALRYYGLAYEKNPHPDLGYRIGQVQEKLGNYQAARDAFASYVEQRPSSPYLERINAKIAKLDEQIAGGQPVLALSTDPAGASVTINELKQAEVTPHRYPLGAGTYRIRLELEGYASLEDEVSLSRGQVLERDYKLEAKQAEVTPEPAPEPEPEPAPEPEPEPEPAPRPASQPDRPVTVVDIRRPLIASVAGWGAFFVGTSAFAYGLLGLSLGADDPEIYLIAAGGMLLIGGGSYLFFVRDWGSDYERLDARDASGWRGAQLPKSPVLGPSVKFEF